MDLGYVVLGSNVASEEFSQSYPVGTEEFWLAEHVERGKPGVSLDPNVLPVGATPLFSPPTSEQCGRHALSGPWQMLPRDKSNVYVGHVLQASSVRESSKFNAFY